MAYLIIALVLLALAIVAWAVPRFKAMAACARVRAAEDAAALDRYSARVEGIVALPMEEARRRAELLLADPEVFDCVEAPVPELPDVLAPALYGLFSRFERIGTVQDEAILSRDLLKPFGGEWEDGPWRRHQFWQIGRESGHVYALIMPHQEGIYEIEELEEGEDVGEPDFPSVYHWLLKVALEYAP